jgi:hypothetical protein
LKTQNIERLGAGRFSGLFANIPGYSLAERLVDIFEKRQRVRLIVTSDDYVEVRILWGAFEFTKGSKREFLIEGGPNLCEATMKSLGGSKRTVNVVSRAIGDGNSPAS